MESPHSIHMAPPKASQIILQHCCFQLIPTIYFPILDFIVLPFFQWNCRNWKDQRWLVTTSIHSEFQVNSCNVIPIKILIEINRFLKCITVFSIQWRNSTAFCGNGWCRNGESCMWCASLEWLLILVSIFFWQPIRVLRMLLEFWKLLWVAHECSWIECHFVCTKLTLEMN